MLYALTASKAVAAVLAYRVDPTAGAVLAATLTWLSAAAALGTATWRLNPDPSTGKPQPLVPRKVVTATTNTNTNGAVQR